MATTGLKFFPNSHKYTYNGVPIPGVTTLLSNGVPKPALAPWAAKSVAEWVADNGDEVAALLAGPRAEAVRTLKGVPWAKRDTAAVRGTAVHALAEQLIHGAEVDVPAHLVGYVEGYTRWLDTFDVQPILTERRVINTHWWYAGTFDAIVDIGGETLLVDLKTSNRIYGEVAAQVAAYANAEVYLEADGSEVPLPKIDGLGAVHVTPTGSSLYRFRDPAGAWKFFQHAAWVAKSLDAIKAQVGEPEPEPVAS